MRHEACSVVTSTIISLVCTTKNINDKKLILRESIKIILKIIGEKSMLQ